MFCFVCPARTALAPLPADMRQDGLRQCGCALRRQVYGGDFTQLIDEDSDLPMAAFGDLDRARRRFARKDRHHTPRSGGQSLENAGESGWDRTIDTLIKSQVLYH